MGYKDFKFDLYRLNIVDEDQPMLDIVGTPIRTDADLLRVLDESTNPKYDTDVSSNSTTFRWSARRYVDYEVSELSNTKVVGISLARSVLSRESQIVTDTDIVEGVSRFSPAPATAINILFYLERHYIAVEVNSEIFSSNVWKEAIESIFKTAAFKLGFSSGIHLEPQPKKEEILKAFNSFSKLTRIRVTLRIPNPDLTRFTKKLFEDLREGGVREYKQDMKNPNGLNKTEGALPHASAAMAQDGYKEGEVILEGIRNGKKQKVVTGRRAARGEIQQVKDFVRGVLTAAKSREAKTVLGAIIEEINHITEKPLSGE